eukprot:TRINITY_DN6042_c0_g1_i4.p1 TRINITY_DN6042_c0_g1~~TRINITY_DN6042_c0_g1_i4.p1  ORF type:complete len:529 (+),score=76.20 TRINITY_DN6042_c0_g1_i4:235-1821(+)
MGQDNMASIDGKRKFMINSDSGNEGQEYESNYIRTTKYTFYSFVPVALFRQFYRLANIYFLVTAIVQSISIISPLHPVSAIAPLVFVLLVSMAREGIEDFRRYQEDKKINGQPIKILSHPSAEERGKRIKKFQENFPKIKDNFPECYDLVESSEIKVGQVVLIEENEVFPADLILLGTSKSSSKAYIQTAMLDGETSLKERTTFNYINNVSRRDRFTLGGEVECANPTPILSEFTATFTWGSKSEAFTEKQLLLKGSVLSDTEWVVGVVAFAGEKTKIMLNTSTARIKQSRVERIMNFLILIVLGIEFILCALLGIFAALWQKNNEDEHIYTYYQYSPGVEFVLRFFSYFILLNTLIPISLIVTLEVIKFFQLFFMQWDVFMYKNGYYAKVSNCSINEELGQVKYIFSDKTGTLTRNELRLVAIRVFDENYGIKMDNSGKIGDNLFNDNKFKEHINGDPVKAESKFYFTTKNNDCLLYTSDAADDTPCVDLGGRRIIKKKKTKNNNPLRPPNAHEQEDYDNHLRHNRE